MKEGKLSYNYENDRYGIINSSDLWANEGLHCGESFHVLVDDKWMVDRIEMDRSGTWYLVNSKLEGNKLEGLKIKY